MASLWPGQPSLELGVRVVRVAGLAAEDQRRLEGGALFVRYFVPAGDGRRRLRVDTREVPADDAAWGELARFERWGDAGAAAFGGSAGGITFELRWRQQAAASSSGLAARLLGAGRRKRPASRVLARAELLWRDAAVQPAERWLALSPAGGELAAGCGEPPKLLVEVDVRAATDVVGAGEATERRPGGARECCGRDERCSQCGWVGNEEDMFLAATFSC